MCPHIGLAKQGRASSCRLVVLSNTVVLTSGFFPSFNQNRLAFFIFQIHLLDLKSLQRTKTGQVIDLISNDVQRIEFAAKWALLATVSVVEFLMAMIVLLYFIGWEALMGVLLPLATIPVILILSGQCAKLRQQTAEVSDQRISLMNELVFGIRSLKANTWEDNYREKVKEKRR